MPGKGLEAPHSNPEKDPVDLHWHVGGCFGVCAAWSPSGMLDNTNDTNFEMSFSFF